MGFSVGAMVWDSDEASDEMIEIYLLRTLLVYCMRRR
jgi:hypothetical protein